MSKIGKKTIAIPKESKVTLNQDKLLISGPKGSHEVPINAKIFSAEIKENLLKHYFSLKKQFVMIETM